MRIAVLGANGQVGVAICRQIAATQGGEVVAVVRNRVAGAFVRAVAGPRVTIRVGSVGDALQAPELIGDCKAVINCAFASSGGILASRQANHALFDGVRTAAPDAYFVHLSSVAVYGPGAVYPSRPRPDTSYGREKLEHENYLKSQLRNDRLLIVRLGHVYGADTPISRFVLDCLLEPGFRLPVPDAAASNSVSKDVVAASLVAACQRGRPTGVHHLTDHPNRSWRELFDLHANALELPSVPSHPVAGQPAETRILPVFAATLRSVVRPPELTQLSANPTVRRGVDALLGVTPAGIENWIRRWYRSRVVRGQTKGCGSLSVASAPNWFYIGAMDDPRLKVPDGVDVDGEALQEWGRRVLDPRWALASRGGLDTADAAPTA